MEYIFQASARELVPKDMDPADRRFDMVCRRRELYCPTAAGPTPIVSDGVKRGPDANLTLGSVDLWFPIPLIA